MAVPWCVQATCTAVNEAGSFPSAILTMMTPPWLFELPTAVSWVFRSTVKRLPLPVVGGGVAPPTSTTPGAGSHPNEPHAARPQPAHTTTKKKPNFAKNTQLSKFPPVILIINLRY